ncbi:MAG: energy transducer TonB [Bacteroidetes bacterium]|nr:energy transducer TonB [Bacteroidota bacterium]
MKLLTVNNLSSFTSILLHACLFIILIFIVNQKSPQIKDQFVEIGFGGTTETNSPGSPGGSIDEPAPQIPKKEPEKIKVKEKRKPQEETISDKSKKEKKETQTTASSDSSKGNSSGKLIAGNSGEGSGSGTGNGQPGSGAPKKGLYIPNDIYYVAVDQMPVPIGGMEGINARAFYPPSAKINNVQGTVYILAFIDERGNVRKISLLKGIGYGCDQSAERAVKETRFEPGEMHGVPVKVQLTIPIKFSPNN